MNSTQFKALIDYIDKRIDEKIHINEHGYKPHMTKEAISKEGMTKSSKTNTAKNNLKRTLFVS